jgi:hypothetical protein
VKYEEGARRGPVSAITLHYERNSERKISVETRVPELSVLFIKLINRYVN